MQHSRSGACWPQYEKAVSLSNLGAWPAGMGRGSARRTDGGTCAFPVPLSAIRELDEPFWYAEQGDEATCRSVALHAKLIDNTDLSFPIILSQDGGVMDGMHRVCKALNAGLKTILAVQFEDDPDRSRRRFQKRIVTPEMQVHRRVKPAAIVHFPVSLSGRNIQVSPIYQMPSLRSEPAIAAPC